MHIRQARETEHRILSAISFAAKGYWNYPAEYFQIWTDELTITSEYIAENKVFVAESEGTVIGYYSIKNLIEERAFSGITIDQGFWLEHMFILPEHIGNRVGTKMVSHLKTICEESNIGKISVLADPNAKEFYEKMGFEYKKEYPSTIPGRTTPLLELKLTPHYQKKSTTDEIRKRFDKDVERFSNLETGQSATIDAPLAMELITQAACTSTKKIDRVLDIGCGAGNNTLKLLESVSPLECDLVDLSLPMLEKAKERISEINTGTITLFQGDFRDIDLSEQHYDVIFAAAVLHHLRGNRDWESVFEKIFRLTAPGGSVWITDLISHETDSIQTLMWNRYGDYLRSLGGESYRDKVFEYIDKEDSPRPVTYQIELLKKVGFNHVELLHKNSCFAAFGAIKTA